jgi:hypothetical protein
LEDFEVSNLIETLEVAFKKGKEELSRAVYLEDCGSNAGIRKMNSNKADWLKWVMYLAEIGLEAEKLFTEKEANNELTCTDCSNKYQNIIMEKDHRIIELELKNKQFTERFGRNLAPYLNEVLKESSNETN